MKPIIFSGPMVRAILERRKTQTRRVMKPQPTLNGGFYEWAGGGWSDNITRIKPLLPGHSIANRCPYGCAGDFLWVRETWAGDDWTGYAYRATDPDVLPFGEEVTFYKWKPSIHMPAKAARIVLRIIDVWIERLKQISYADCIAEGIIDLARAEKRTRKEGEAPIEQYESLWDAINSKRGYSWNSNPWVWVIEFQVKSTPFSISGAEETPNPLRLRRVPPNASTNLGEEEGNDE